jgi:hypothetical protein
VSAYPERSQGAPPNGFPLSSESIQKNHAALDKAQEL